MPWFVLDFQSANERQQEDRIYTYQLTSRSRTRIPSERCHSLGRRQMLTIHERAYTFSIQGRLGRTSKTLDTITTVQYQSGNSPTSSINVDVVRSARSDCMPEQVSGRD